MMHAARIEVGLYAPRASPLLHLLRDSQRQFSVPRRLMRQFFAQRQVKGDKTS